MFAAGVWLELDDVEVWDHLKALTGTDGLAELSWCRQKAVAYGLRLHDVLCWFRNESLAGKNPMRCR